MNGWTLGPTPDSGQSHLVSDAEVATPYVPPGGMRPDGHL